MLKCTQDFAQGEHRYTAGDVVQVHPAVASWLLDSFPAYFEWVENAGSDEPETKDIETPPEDKMIRRANRK